MFSVVNLTPRHFLEEIILVDDMSDSGKTELRPSMSCALKAIPDGAWVLLLLISHLMGVEAGAVGSPVGMSEPVPAPRCWAHGRSVLP